MICIHCGRTIKYGAESCPRCKEKTGFDERFSYQPQSAPLPGVTVDQGLETGAMTETRTGRPERRLHMIRTIFARRKKNKER